VERRKLEFPHNRPPMRADPQLSVERMSRALTVLAAFLVSITAVPSAGRGVSYDTLALGRIGSFSLAIEAIDANSQTCGIQKSSISRAIEYPLVGTGLVVRPKDLTRNNRVRVVLVALERWCSSSRPGRYGAEC
jgi:hypothetical protein